MRTLQAWALVVATSVGAFPQHLVGQEPARTDSLEAELRRLQARLDSLQRVIEELLRAGRDTAGAADELAQLRARARAAAAEAEVADTTTQQSQTRNLSILNPEISLTGDVVGNYLAPAGAGNSVGIVPREFEFSFQAAVDPYTRTKIFVSHHEDFEIAGLGNGGSEEEGHGGPEIEEGYLYWVGLPGAIGIKAGHFRQEIGLYNRWHTHALMEADRPLAATTFLGEDGLIQTGASLTLPSFTIGPASQMLTAEATLGTNDALFDGGGGQLSYLGRFQSFWDVGSSSFLQFGATGILGRNRDTDLKTRLVGLDFMFRWTPPSQALYRDLQIKGEWYFAERRESGAATRGNGGYGQVSFRFAQQWFVGTRVDYLTPYDDAEPNVLQVVPSLTWWQSEYVRLRAQYHYVKSQGLAGNHTLLLQLVWAIGPHRHESY